MDLSRWIAEYCRPEKYNARLTTVAMGHRTCDSGTESVPLVFPATHHMLRGKGKGKGIKRDFFGMGGHSTGKLKATRSKTGATQAKDTDKNKDKDDASRQRQRHRHRHRHRQRQRQRQRKRKRKRKAHESRKRTHENHSSQRQSSSCH